MKRKLLNNIGMKLISVAAALVIWLIIVNVDDAYDTKSITLEVQEINAEDLASINKTYEVVSGETATAKIRGRASVLKDLSNTDFTATADLSKLSDTGAVWVDIKAKDYVKGIEIMPDNNVYQVVTENLVEKQFSVVVKTRGSVAKGYDIGEIKVTPNIINIRGSETKISNIKEVAVTIDVSGYSSNINKVGLVPTVYELNGSAMDTSRLTMDVTTVDVSMTMLRTKTIPVKVTYKGEPADGYVVVSKVSGESEVTVAGTKADLDKLSVLNVECDIEGASENIEKTILYKDFLPENIYLSEGDKETSGVAVNVVIEPVISKDVDVKFSDIGLTGASDELEYSIYNYNEENVPDTVSVSVSGAKSAVDAVKAEDIRVTADVSNYGIGVYSIQLNVQVTGQITAKENQKMVIQIKNKE